MNKSASPPSLEALLSNLSLYEEIPSFFFDKGAFSSLGDLFGRKEVHGVQNLMKDAMPFKVAVFISVCFLPFFFRCLMLTVLFHFTHRWVFLGFIWRGIVSTDNTSSVDSLPCMKVLERCIARSKRSLECLRLRESWRRLGLIGLLWLRNALPRLSTLRR